MQQNKLEYSNFDSLIFSQCFDLSEHSHLSIRMATHFDAFRVMLAYIVLLLLIFEISNYNNNLLNGNL